MKAKTLVCFPFAGAGASVFRSWLPNLEGRFHVLAVQLPGREQRFLEKPFGTIEQTIDSLLPSLSPELSDSSEIVFFGHSMGAMLAYELARRFNAELHQKKCRLVVSGSSSPINPRTINSDGLNDSEFVMQIEQLIGYAHPAFADPELRELILPALRADVEMHQRYRPIENFKLSMPVQCVRGADDTLVSYAEAQAWQEITSAPLEYVEIEGTHMYLVEDPSELFALL